MYKKIVRIVKEKESRYPWIYLTLRYNDGHIFICYSEKQKQTHWRRKRKTQEACTR